MKGKYSAFFTQKRFALFFVMFINYTKRFPDSDTEVASLMFARGESQEIAKSGPVS
jgi:hypothetical protein